MAYAYSASDRLVWQTKSYIRFDDECLMYHNADLAMIKHVAKKMTVGGLDDGIAQETGRERERENDRDQQVE